ncbi:L,D-transpeptidase family protein [Streptomyces cadmiisoli]|uniref:L,D-transpeptidase family protein n=1 Tax=Streptomyces cadmiisoli TaxID=2184053 RepID=UPI0036602CFB
MTPHTSTPFARSRRIVVAATVGGALLLTTGCADKSDEAADSVGVEPADSSLASETEAPTAKKSPTSSASATKSPSASASPSAAGTASSSADQNRSGDGSSTRQGSGSTAADAGSDSGPNFPVPVQVGNATQVITVKSSGSYATVTAWAKGSSGWKAQFSSTAGRVGSNGVTAGATRQQGTYTTPSGTYTITEGFGVESSGTAMPYRKVVSTDWWVQDPESKFYNSMHSEEGADFPLTEAGERGSERLINYPTQYAKALVVNFNRWPAVPGRGAGIFLHVNGSGATAGCVSVPKATMDQFMNWISPSAHPRIAIG